MGHPWLEQRYEELCAEPSDIHEHLPTFVSLVKELKATKVVELGVRYGVSTIAWLYALEDQGYLWACDCSFPVPAPGSTINNLDPQGPLGVRTHWTFILGDFHTKEIASLFPTKADIIFIDSNHVYGEVLNELEMYYPKVRKGGRILLHDTTLEFTGNDPDSTVKFPVRTAMIEFCEKKNLKWSNDERCNGLGQIYC